MQSCSVVGNVASIRKIEGTNKVFITVADHYNGKDENGKYVQKTNYVPLEGFLPEGLKIVPGQLIGAQFRVTQYKSAKENGNYKVACDIVSIEVRLNNISKEKRDAAMNASAGSAPAAEAEPAPAEEYPDMEVREDLPFGNSPATAAEKAAGKKSAK